MTGEAVLEELPVLKATFGDKLKVEDIGPISPKCENTQLRISMSDKSELPSEVRMDSVEPILREILGERNVARGSHCRTYLSFRVPKNIEGVVITQIIDRIKTLIPE